MESVILVNLGTPQAPEPGAVRRFLEVFLSDPMVVDYPRWVWSPILSGILRSRPRKVAALYRSVWSAEGSPLTVGTRRMAEALAAETGTDVRFAFRYTEPTLESALAAGGGRTTVVPLFPQRTGSSSGTIEALVGERADIARIAPDEPGYIAALAGRWRESVGGDPPQHFVVSFHAIPVRYDRAEGGRYRRDCETTFRALLAEIGWPESDASLAYQSRFGPEPWIGPATAAVLRRLPRTGVRSVAVATPGFLTEGLETLEEIGIRGKAGFLGNGGERFVRIPCVEDHPELVRSLADALVTEELVT